MHNLLDAPCMFCGYSGAGYYQAGTHAKDCPWYNVGGDSERYGKLPGVITALFKERQNTSTGSPKLPTLEECINGIVSFDNKGLSPYDGAKLMYDYICRQLRAGA
jgi:hypothetical protein